MSIGRKFGNFMDWMMEGSSPVVITKITGAIAAVTGAIMVPFICISIHNSNQLEKTFKKLDQGPTIVFNSVSECVAKGYSPEECEASQREALSISKELGTTVSYDTREECEENHGMCNEEVFMQPIVITTGKSTTITYIPQTTYIPPVEAWQAAVDDLSIAVPLYKALDERTVVRKDGVQFDID